MVEIPDHADKQEKAQQEPGFQELTTSYTRLYDNLENKLLPSQSFRLSAGIYNAKSAKDRSKQSIDDAADRELIQRHRNVSLPADDTLHSRGISRTPDGNITVSQIGKDLSLTEHIIDNTGTIPKITERTQDPNYNTTTRTLSVPEANAFLTETHNLIIQEYGKRITGLAAIDHTQEDTEKAGVDQWMDEQLESGIA